MFSCKKTCFLKNPRKHVFLFQKTCFLEPENMFSCPRKHVFWKPENMFSCFRKHVFLTPENMFSGCRKHVFWVFFWPEKTSRKQSENNKKTSRQQSEHSHLTLNRLTSRTYCGAVVNYCIATSTRFALCLFSVFSQAVVYNPIQPLLKRELAIHRVHVMCLAYTAAALW